MLHALADSHCHLDMLDDVDHAINFAGENGVGYLLCVSVNLEDWPKMMAIVERFPNIYASVGVHPNEREGKDPSIAELVELASHPKVVAIGETGLDYHYHNQDSATWQRERFRRHIAAAKQCQKPIIVHSREAKADVIRILQEENAAAVGGVMHCYVDDWATAVQAMEMNFYISFSGIVTFRTALELKEVAKQAPLDRMLVETDSPYLAPVPYRGKTNQPAYTRNVAEHIAELRGLSFEDVSTATTANFLKLFKIA